MPVVAPFAPGNRPKMLSKLRFSMIRKTTCLIGVRVSIVETSTASGSGWVTTVGVPDTCGAWLAARVGDDGCSEVSSLVQATATSANAASTAIRARTRGRADLMGVRQG